MYGTRGLRLPVNKNPHSSQQMQYSLFLLQVCTVSKNATEVPAALSGQGEQADVVEHYVG